ncbi:MULTISPECIES: PHP domain-containing protein [Bacillaceae]|nr:MULTISPECIES: PHP domain-containing protein [Bacillaceae]
MDKVMDIGPKRDGKKADLHMHSTMSDGGYPPEDLMRKCAAAGLHIVSLTDHDTTKGLERAKEVAKQHKMEFIPGIELSTRDVTGTGVDILGYGINPADEMLLQTLEFHQNMRIGRMEKMIDHCQQHNLDVDFEEVKKYAKGDTYSRPHLAKVLVDKGYVKTVKEAFDLYLGQNKPCYVPKEKDMSPKEAIELIHQAGGVAVVAHPIFYELDNSIYKWLTEDGLDGIEVYHRDHDEQAVQRFLTLAVKAEEARGAFVLKTGGSDFHHESFGREGEQIGQTKLPFYEAEKLLKRL